MTLQRKKNSHSFSMRLPVDILSAITKIADDEGVNRTDIVVAALRLWLSSRPEYSKDISEIAGRDVSVKELSFAKLFDDANLLVESSLTPAGYPAVFFSMPFGNGVYRLAHVTASLTERNLLFSRVDRNFAMRFVDEFSGIYSVEDAAFEYGKEFAWISELISSLLPPDEKITDAF